MATTPKTTENGRKKPTAKQAAAAKAATAKTEGGKTTSRKKTSPASVPPTSRVQMIEVAAYYIAEKHGFDHQHMDHWLAAEKEIDRQLDA